MKLVNDQTYGIVEEYLSDILAVTFLLRQKRRAGSVVAQALLNNFDRLFFLLLFCPAKKVTKKGRPKTITARFRCCALIELWYYCGEQQRFPGLRSRWTVYE